MKKILIVDDDWSLCELLTLRFKREGLQVSTAKTGQEFMDKVSSEHPDLVLLDIMLGPESGPAVYEKVIASGLDKKMPIVFMSALLEDHPEKKLSQSHHVALYRKPFDTRQLAAEVAAYLAA